MGELVYLFWNFGILLALKNSGNPVLKPKISMVLTHLVMLFKIVMLSDAFYCNAECHYADCLSARIQKQVDKIYPKIN